MNILQDDVRANIKPSVITMDTLIPTIINLMTSVEKLKLRGQDKKNMVISLVEFSIDTAVNMSAQQKYLFKGGVEDLLPTLIDSVIWLSKNKDMLNAFKHCNISCCF